MKTSVDGGFSSFFLGLLFLSLLFVFCCITVLGVKAFLSAIGIEIKIKKPHAADCTPSEKPKRVRRKVRSIEIDPQEINRISVKKS